MRQASIVAGAVCGGDSQFIMMDNWHIFTTWNVHNDGDLVITYFLCMDFIDIYLMVNMYEKKDA